MNGATFGVFGFEWIVSKEHSRECCTCITAELLSNSPQYLKRGWIRERKTERRERERE